jgi:hypothetical protein
MNREISDDNQDTETHIEPSTEADIEDAASHKLLDPDDPHHLHPDAS